MATTTDMKPDGLALAGLGLDKDLLLHVARLLLTDIYWDEALEADYREWCREGHFKVERELMKRSVKPYETPQIPDDIDAMIRMAGICGRIEQAWGESFYSVTRRILGYDRPKYETKAVPFNWAETQAAFDELQEKLVYLTFMACIGHGIGPDSIDGFPGDSTKGTYMNPHPILIENPMLFQLSLLE